MHIAIVKLNLFGQSGPLPRRRMKSLQLEQLRTVKESNTPTSTKRCAFSDCDLGSLGTQDKRDMTLVDKCKKHEIIEKQL